MFFSLQVYRLYATFISLLKSYETEFASIFKLDFLYLKNKIW